MNRVTKMVEAMAPVVDDVGLEGCSLEDCARVFQAGYEADIRPYVGCGDNAAKAIEYSCNAGIIRVCEHLWSRIIDAGRKRISKAVDEDTVDLFCCIKRDCCSGERIHVDGETGKCKVVVAAASERCFYHRKNVGLHFSMLRDIVLVEVKNTLREFHPSMSQELIDFMDHVAWSRCPCSGKRVTMPSHALCSRLVDRDLCAVRAEMSPFIFGPCATTTPLSLTRGNELLSYSVDLLDLSHKVMYAHYKAHGCRYGDCSKADRIKEMCSNVLNKFGDVTDFYLFPETNRSMRALVAELEREKAAEVKVEAEAEKAEAEVKVEAAVEAKVKVEAVEAEVKVKVEAEAAAAVSSSRKRRAPGSVAVAVA